MVSLTEQTITTLGHLKSGLWFYTAKELCTMQSVDSPSEAAEEAPQKGGGHVHPQMTCPLLDTALIYPSKETVIISLLFTLLYWYLLQRVCSTSCVCLISPPLWLSVPPWCVSTVSNYLSLPCVFSVCVRLFSSPVLPHVAVLFPRVASCFRSLVFLSVFWAGFSLCICSSASFNLSSLRLCALVCSAFGPWNLYTTSLYLSGNKDLFLVRTPQQVEPWRCDVFMAKVFTNICRFTQPADKKLN